MEHALFYFVTILVFCSNRRMCTVFFISVTLTAFYEHCLWPVSVEVCLQNDLSLTELAPIECLRDSSLSGQNSRFVLANNVMAALLMFASRYSAWRDNVQSLRAMSNSWITMEVFRM